jgi:hypothetical protein
MGEPWARNRARDEGGVAMVPGCGFYLDVATLFYEIFPLRPAAGIHPALS